MKYLKSNNSILVLLFAVIVFSTSSCKKNNNVSSPDGNLIVECGVSDLNEAYYSITKSGQEVILPSKLGIIMSDADFSTNLKLVSVSSKQLITDSYTLQHGKQNKYEYQGNERVYTFKTSEGKLMEVIFRVSNDGAAFRYHFPGQSTDTKTITEELSSFNFGEGTKAWIQPMAPAKTGWSICNPSYEENYAVEIEAGTPSPMGKGWIFPALFKSNTDWVLLTESDLDATYCGSRLITPEDATYRIGFPETIENIPGKGTLPISTLPWKTPWRVIAIGDLKTIAESSLETDLASPPSDIDYSWVKPGKSSWSWVLLKDDSTVFDVQKRFIDYAADMNWDYCLVDADWDQKIGYEKLGELVAYGAEKGVNILAWYNSSGDWNETPYTPKSKLLTHEQRLEEYSRLKEMGIKGVKVDFFGGDGQSMIEYYIDHMKDAARFNLAINFHGCTYPRSWHRTYPNLVTMESVKGMEYATFEQENADLLPQLGTILPFTRNVFSPMDFTPMCLHAIPNIDRKTTNAYELATSVMYLSGIQHYAETPTGMASVPDEIKGILRSLPALWDESVLIDGYPGKLAIMARRKDNTWYIAGLNGEPNDKEVVFSLPFIENGDATLITEGETPFSFSIINIEHDNSKEHKLTIKGNGGFIMKWN
jgi:alpha-glucosidase